MENKKYGTICPKCGAIDLFYVGQPNMGIIVDGSNQAICVPYNEAKLNENAAQCIYCRQAIISMDKTDEEYRLQYKELTGRFPDDESENLFIETTYFREHEETLKNVFSQIAKDTRLKRIEDEKCEGAMRRQQQHEEYRAKALGIKRWSSNCPRCGSNEISTRRNGLSLLPNSFINVCQKCGKKWKPGK